MSQKDAPQTSDSSSDGQIDELRQPPTGSLSDLSVIPISQALSGIKLDVIVSGSIAAVESVRFIRALRRRGASVTPWLTDGGAQFVTELALSWAAACATKRHFSGDASHIALGDACVVAPASANFICGIAHGQTNTPSLALGASYLGLNRPLMLVANMHNSLGVSPAVIHNCEVVRRYGGSFLQARQEEGKQKFPDPEALADEVAHRVNRERIPKNHRSALITLGTTRGYVDDVRYFSNYSSGRLGSLIAEELYRLGIATDVVVGPCQYQPKVFTRYFGVTTHDDMDQAVKQSLSRGAAALVMCASVLDFTPVEKSVGKLRTKDHSELTIKLKKTAKIIAEANPSSGIKVGFKLEAQLNRQRMLELADTYMNQYGLSLFVVNDLAEVNESDHRAVVFEKPLGSESGQWVEQEVVGKTELARSVAKHVALRLA